MGSVQKDVQGTTGSNAASYTLAQVAAEDSITASHIQDIADAYSDEITRRVGTPGTYTFTANTKIEVADLEEIIDDLEAVNPPKYDPGYTANPGTVSAPGSGNNTNVQHDPEVALTWNVGVFTTGISSDNAALASGVKIFASTINAIRSKVIAAGAVCTCNCNYCTCNCNYACTCNCNY